MGNWPAECVWKGLADPEHRGPPPGRRASGFHSSDVCKLGISEKSNKFIDMSKASLHLLILNSKSQNKKGQS